MVKMIAVWGSNGSGKKVISLALASKLAERRKNVVVINTDSSVPALPVFLPREQITPEGSIGKLLTTEFQSYNALKGYIHLHPESSHIGFMGIASGETPITYDSLKSFNRNNMMSLLKVLNDSPFDYIIFSCISNPALDSLTQLALQTAEYPVRIITPDVKGVEFEKSQTKWLRGIPGMRVEEQIRIINPVRTTSPVDEVVALSGAADYMLPFSEEIYGKSIAGKLIRGCGERYGIQVEKKMAQLAERIMSDERSGS